MFLWLILVFVLVFVLHLSSYIPGSKDHRIAFFNITVDDLLIIKRNWKLAAALIDVPLHHVDVESPPAWLVLTDWHARHNHSIGTLDKRLNERKL